MGTKQGGGTDPRERIRRYMARHRVTASDLAGRAGISRRTIHYVLAGQRITDHVARQLAPVVGVSWQRLYEPRRNT